MLKMLLQFGLEISEVFLNRRCYLKMLKVFDWKRSGLTQVCYHHHTSLFAFTPHLSSPFCQILEMRIVKGLTFLVLSDLYDAAFLFCLNNLIWYSRKLNASWLSQVIFDLRLI